MTLKRPVSELGHPSENVGAFDLMQAAKKQRPSLPVHIEEGPLLLSDDTLQYCLSFLPTVDLLQSVCLVNHKLYHAILDGPSDIWNNRVIELSNFLHPTNREETENRVRQFFSRCCVKRFTQVNLTWVPMLMTLLPQIEQVDFPTNYLPESEDSMAHVRSPNLKSCTVSSPILLRRMLESSPHLYRIDYYKNEMLEDDTLQLILQRERLERFHCMCELSDDFILQLLSKFKIRNIGLKSIGNSIWSSISKLQHAELIEDVYIENYKEHTDQFHPIRPLKISRLHYAEFTPSIPPYLSELINSCRNTLCHLEIDNLSGLSNFDNLQALPNLRYFKCEACNNIKLCHQIICSASKTLEELKIEIWEEQHIFVGVALPRLHTLTIQFANPHYLFFLLSACVNGSLKNLSVTLAESDAANPLFRPVKLSRIEKVSIMSSDNQFSTILSLLKSINEPTLTTLDLYTVTGPLEREQLRQEFSACSSLSTFSGNLDIFSNLPDSIVSQLFNITCTDFDGGEEEEEGVRPTIAQMTIEDVLQFSKCANVERLLIERNRELLTVTTFLATVIQSMPRLRFLKLSNQVPIGVLPDHCQLQHLEEVHGAFHGNQTQWVSLVRSMPALRVFDVLNRPFALDNFFAIIPLLNGSQISVLNIAISASKIFVPKVPFMSRKVRLHLRLTVCLNFEEMILACLCLSHESCDSLQVSFYYCRDDDQQLTAQDVFDVPGKVLTALNRIEGISDSVRKEITDQCSRGELPLCIQKLTAAVQVYFFDY